MNDKYYIPEIEEFHSGFSYEYLDYKDKWNKSDEFTNDWDWEDNPHYAVIKAIDRKKVRVKYLDKDDIEELGWVIFDNIAYSIQIKENYYLLWNINNMLIINKGFIGDLPKDTLLIFKGTIKNKSELKRLMKQLGIWKT